jgi:hypothetical protein
MAVPGQPGQKVHKTLYQQKKLGVVACTCHLGYGRKRQIGESLPRQAPAKSMIISQRVTRAKMVGGMTQTIEHLPSSKCETLSSTIVQAK